MNERIALCQSNNGEIVSIRLVTSCNINTHVALTFSGESKARLNVFSRQIGEIIQNFVNGHSGRQITQNVERQLLLPKAKHIDARHTLLLMSFSIFARQLNRLIVVRIVVYEFVWKENLLSADTCRSLLLVTS